MTRPTKARPRVVTSWSPDVNPAVMQRGRAVPPNVSAGASHVQVRSCRRCDVPLPPLHGLCGVPLPHGLCGVPPAIGSGRVLHAGRAHAAPIAPLTAWSPVAVVAAGGSTPRSGSVPPVIQALGAPIPERRAQPSAPGGARGGRRSQTGPRTRPVRQDGGRAPRRSREGARHDVSQSGRAPVSGGQ